MKINYLNEYLVIKSSFFLSLILVIQVVVVILSIILDSSRIAGYHRLASENTHLLFVALTGRFQQTSHGIVFPSWSIVPLIL